MRSGLFVVMLVLALVAGLPARPAAAQGGRVYLPLVMSGYVPPDPPPAAPGCTATSGFDQVHLTWTGNTSTSLTVVWRTLNAGTPSTVQYRVAGSNQWLTATGAPRPSGTEGTLHEVTVSGLAPGAAYDYCVRSSSGAFSTPFSVRTAPAGEAAFTAVYVADTGLVGRGDGLATGTQQVVDRIAELKPDVVLGGGDYAYFDSDKQHGTYERSIDAWFNQMQPIIAHAPLMATYGNHEYELDGQPNDVRPWMQRLPTPPGFIFDRAPGSEADKLPNFSFDVGSVHFVALFAASDRFGVPDPIKAWLTQDMQAARDRGMRWIIPYYHVPPFGDGDNHDANLMVREDVGPIFEQFGVPVALASHDQAYERSYPLVDVPAANRATYNSQTCYTSDDGTTYVKVSPGGKESNISGAFSPFKTAVKPAWTAVRDNTMHHFARLIFAANGDLTFETWGVMPEGAENWQPPRVIDSFRYTVGGCAP